jgi:transposase
MSYIEGKSREQRILFPEVLDDYIGEDHVVRLIDAFVESASIAAFTDENSAAGPTPNP